MVEGNHYFSETYIQTENEVPETPVYIIKYYCLDPRSMSTMYVKRVRRHLIYHYYIYIIIVIPFVFDLILYPLCGPVC